MLAPRMVDGFALYQVKGLARIAFLSGLLRMSGMYDDGWLLDGFSRCVRSNVL